MKKTAPLKTFWTTKTYQKKEAKKTGRALDVREVISGGGPLKPAQTFWKKRKKGMPEETKEVPKVPGGD